MTRTLTPPAPVTLANFDAMFEAVKNWGRWGPDDERGTLNYLTPDKVAAAAAPGAQRAHRLDGHSDQQGGRARQPQPRRAPHVAHARPPGQRKRAVLRDVLPGHGQPRRLPYPRRCAQSRGLSGTALQRQARRAADLTRLGVGQHRRLCDRHRRPRRAAGRGALSQGRLARARRGGDPRRARGDRGRRRACGSARATSWCSAPVTMRGAWRSVPGATSIRPRARARPGCMSTPSRGCTSGALRPSFPTATARPCRATSRACPIPIHALQLTAMGMCISDSLQLEELAEACEQEGRFEFMVVGLPLRLPGATGTPWNPIAIF